MRRLLPFLLLPTTLAACVVGTPVAITPLPGPVPSFRDVFADTVSPTPSAGPSASASPARKLRTGRPLDVAIAGPGYFALSARPDPRDWADVRLTRHGEFVLEPAGPASPLPGVPAYAMGDWTLKSLDGRYVLGWDLQADPDRLAPPEARGRTLPNALALGGPQAQVLAGPLRLPSLAGAAPWARLDFRGRLTLEGQPTTDADGRMHWLHVAVVMVEDPTKLVDGRYDLDAGTAQAGIAGLAGARGEARRPVGDANAIEPGYLEGI